MKSKDIMATINSVHVIVYTVLLFFFCIAAIYWIYAMDNGQIYLPFSAVVVTVWARWRRKEKRISTCREDLNCESLALKRS